MIFYTLLLFIAKKEGELTKIKY